MPMNNKDLATLFEHSLFATLVRTACNWSFPRPILFGFLPSMGYSLCRFFTSGEPKTADGCIKSLGRVARPAWYGNVIAIGLQAIQESYPEFTSPVQCALLVSLYYLSTQTQVQAQVVVFGGIIGGVLLSITRCAF